MSAGPAAAPPVVDVDRLGEITTKIEEEVTRLWGVRQGLGLLLNPSPAPTQEFLRLLHDQLQCAAEELDSWAAALAEVWRAAERDRLKREGDGGAA